MQVDLVSKHQQLQAVPMLATTLEWQARLANKPVAAPLTGLLTQCSNRLLSNFERFVSDMVSTHSRRGAGQPGGIWQPWILVFQMWHGSAHVQMQDQSQIGLMFSSGDVMMVLV